MKISLTETSRNQMLYKSRKESPSRWDNKNKCKVAATVADFNRIDMNDFWKHDILTFYVKVQGESDTYNVGVSFTNILSRLQDQIRKNHNKVDVKVIYTALFQVLNSSDVKISCDCPDATYRFNYWQTQDNDKLGKPENRPSDITNPDNNKGAGCKHLLAVLNNVEWLQKIASVLNNYINYAKDKMEYNYSQYIFPKLYNREYNDVVQLSINDLDDNGELSDRLKDDEDTINLINALGRVRGRIRKGSNKNPVAQKEREEKAQENLP